MNQSIVDEIAEQLNRVIEIPEVKQIIENSKNFTNFNADYLGAECAKIQSARAKNYPTYRSEYRVTQTLIRQQNQIIYQLKSMSPNINVNSVNIDAVLTEFVELSKLLMSTSKSIGDIFETEKTISNLAAEFDNSWKS